MAAIRSRMTDPDPQGQADKSDTHQAGLLHPAFAHADRQLNIVFGLPVRNGRPVQVCIGRWGEAESELLTIVWPLARPKIMKK